MSFLFFSGKPSESVFTQAQMDQIKQELEGKVKAKEVDQMFHAWGIWGDLVKEFNEGNTGSRIKVDNAYRNACKESADVLRWLVVKYRVSGQLKSYFPNSSTAFMVRLQDDDDSFRREPTPAEELLTGLASAPLVAADIRKSHNFKLIREGAQLLVGALIFLQQKYPEIAQNKAFAPLYIVINPVLNGSNAVLRKILSPLPGKKVEKLAAAWISKGVQAWNAGDATKDIYNLVFKDPEQAPNWVQRAVDAGFNMQHLTRGQTFEGNPLTRTTEPRPGDISAAGLVLTAIAFNQKELLKGQTLDVEALKKLVNQDEKDNGQVEIGIAELIKNGLFHASRDGTITITEKGRQELEAVAQANLSATQDTGQGATQLLPGIR